MKLAYGKAGQQKQKLKKIISLSNDDVNHQVLQLLGCATKIFSASFSLSYSLFISRPVSLSSQFFLSILFSFYLFLVFDFSYFLFPSLSMSTYSLYSLFFIFSLILSFFPYGSPLFFFQISRYNFPPLSLNLSVSL